MLDIKLIRSNPDFVRERLALRGGDYASQVDTLLALDQNYRAGLTQVEETKASLNARSREIGALMKAGQKEQAGALQEQVRAMKAQIEGLEANVRADEEEISGLLSRLPNLPHDSVPEGGEENNLVGEASGPARQFTFTPKPHWELAERLGIIDFARWHQTRRQRVRSL